MTEVTLHATPRERDVVREQIRIVGLGLSREALVAAGVIGILTILIGIDIFRARAATWFDSDEWFPLGIIAFCLPFAVWRREKRFGPAFLWTLPVDRRRLALVKVFGGWLWLMVAIAFFFLWQQTLAILSGVANARTVPLIAFIGLTALYLLGSALVLGLRHPLRWLLGGVGVFALVGYLNHEVGRDMYGINALLNSIAARSTLEHAATLIIFLWLGAGLVALWAAVSRHGEHRRH